MSYFRFISWIDRNEPIHVYGDGSQSRDFTFVDDIALGTSAALRPVGYEIINLGGGNQPYSIDVLIQKIEALLGKKAVVQYHPFEKADMISTWANIEKANRLLDWQPQIDLDSGLSQCVDWYQRNKPWSANIELN